MFAVSPSTLELGKKSCSNFKSMAQHRPIFLLGFHGQDASLCICEDGQHGGMAEKAGGRENFGSREEM